MRFQPPLRQCSSPVPPRHLAAAKAGDESPRDKLRRGESCTGNSVPSASARASLFPAVGPRLWDNNFPVTPLVTSASATNKESCRRDPRNSSPHESKAGSKTFVPPRLRGGSQHRG